MEGTKTYEQWSFFSDEEFFKITYIYLTGEINDQLSETIRRQLQYADYWFNKHKIPREKRVITMEIWSPGRSISSGFAIYDTMNYVNADIKTIGVGLVASMAAFLLASGTKGMRYATSNSEILIHQPLSGTSGQASDVLIACKHIMKIKENINKILSENTGKTVEQIEHDTDRDYIMSAYEAKTYGLIDEVISAKNKTAKKEN